MKFTMNRSRTIATTKGHTLTFEKGVALHVPPEVYSEVMAAGGVPEEELPEDEVRPQTNEPTDPEERKLAVFIAYESIVTRGKREDFTAGGAPHIKAVNAELGWTITNKERDLTWAEFRTKDD